MLWNLIAVTVAKLSLQPVNKGKLQSNDALASYSHAPDRAATVAMACVPPIIPPTGRATKPHPGTNFSQMTPHDPFERPPAGCTRSAKD
jgi:hypothetical protein